MSETAAATTSLAPDTSSVTTINDGTVIDRPEESSTGISRPTWLSETGDATEGTDKKEVSKADEEGAEKEKSETKDETATVDKSATTGPDADDEVKDETTGEQQDTESNETGKVQKHPKGYVPVSAVHEARAELKLTKNELQEANQKIADLEQKVQQKVDTPKQADEFAGFEVLSDEDLDLLADEDPVAAANYARKLVKYERYAAEHEANKGKRAEQEKHNRIQRQVAYDRIAEVVPDAEANKAMTKFALDNGFPSDAFFLTDPSTLVLPQGATSPIPLNQYAAEIVTFIKNVQESVRGKDVSSLTIDDIPEDLKAEIVADASDKILGKVKGSTKARSVGKIPSSNRDNGDRFAGRSYAELNNEEEKKAYLGG